jgi:hypothetical protein
VPTEREAFIQAVAAELERHAILGEGLLHRTVASLQREFTVMARSEANPASEPRHVGRRPSHRGPQRSRSLLP